MESTDYKWYALYTRPKCEKKAVETLKQRGVETYCPLRKKVSQWSDRRKVIFEPLFTSYVFVRLGKNDFQKIRNISSVVGFVYWLSKPAIIQDEEITVINKFLSEYSDVSLEMHKVNINDKVRILGGPLMEREGVVLEIKHRLVKVLLPNLGYVLIANVERRNLETAEPSIIRSIKPNVHSEISSNR